MYNYQFELVRTIDIALLSVLILVSLAIAVSAFVKDYFWNRRTSGLLNIKMFIYPLVLERKDPASAANTPFIVNITPQQFLDIEMNRAREAVSFNDAERNFLRGCFATPDRAVKLEKSAVKSRNKVRRVEAILCLGYAGVKSATGALKNVLIGKDKDASYFSLIALGQIKTTLSAKILLEFLRKTPPSSYKIISALEDFPSDIVDDVITLVDDPNPHVRVWGMKLLSRFPAEHYIKKIEKLTCDETAEVRASACEYLGNIGIKESKDVLAKRLKDESWLVRMHAVRALSRTLGDEAIPELVSLINDASWSVNNAVKDAMAIYTKASFPYVERFLAGDDIIAQKYSLEILRDSGYIKKILKDAIMGEERDKTYAMQLLRRIVSLKAHSTLEAEIIGLDADMQARVLALLNTMDKELAEHIEKKMTYKTKES